MLLAAVKREPKAQRVFRLMIWGSVFLFGGAGYIIWKALDEGIRHAGFGFVLMLIGVGLGLAARQMERRLPANGEKATPPTDAGSAPGGETTA